MNKSNNQKLVETPELSELIYNMPGYIYWKNINSEYMGCNKNLALLSGLNDPSEIVGKKDADFFWGKDQAEAFIKDDQEVMQAGTVKITEHQLPGSDASTNMLIRTEKIPIYNKEGQPVGVMGVAVDITERKKMEESLLEAKEEAEAANQTKSEFLATVSHELRIPLTGILGMAGLLMDSELKSDQHQQVSSIITGGEHLLALVNDLLDLAKFEAGKLELHPAPLDLRKLLEEITTMLSPQAHRKNIELVVDYARDVPHSIIGDQRAIRQIFLNLIGNAIKFTEKGYITLRVDCLEQNDSEARLSLNVEDTGIGIPPEKLASVFERFNQVDSSHGRRYRGAGLGLTITKAYTELMGGEIHAESEVGKGSCFSCVIPFRLQSGVRNTTVWDPYKSTVQILIIDDTLRGEIMQKHLDSSLTQVVPGNQALNTLLAAQQRKQPFHIVIMDYQLHTADAFELIQTITAQCRISSPLMLLLITPTVPASTREQAVRLGFYECFTKPIHPTELLVRLTAAWEKWEEVLEEQREEKPVVTNQKIKILLVEDDPIIQAVHSMMLKKMGCEVDIAGDAEHALAMYKNGYDGILLDVGLPGKTGIDVANEIRREEADKAHIPIIGLTGYGLEEDKQNCLNAGMDDVAVKPIKPDLLKSLIEQWIVKGMPLSEAA